jgi:hypothetical protein
VLFRYQKQVRAGKLKAIFPALDKRGRLATRVAIETIYLDMADKAHTREVTVRHSAIVGLQEQEKREVPS